MTNPHLLAALTLVTACGHRPAVAVPPRPPPSTLATRPATLDELLRIRCALDDREVITTWTGSVYAYLPDEQPQRVFDLVGMNIARCLRVADAWHLTSRELMLYLDPRTGEMLDRWHNPWTDLDVPVVHVANRLVQAELGGGAPLEIADGTATLVLDIPLFYPNPFAGDASLRPYSPAPTYQGGEFFALSAPAAAVVDPTLRSVPTMAFTWHRLGPWLPWMAMGARPGYLLYRAHGRKVAGLGDLAPLLQGELTARLAIYRHAPRCVVPARNETSWSYFARVLPAYLASARFPLPAPEDPAECAARQRNP